MNEARTDFRYRIIFIVGPTAVGKSSVALALARAIGGEIVSCDSMQVYREVRIASNRPTDEEMNQVAHHLVGIVSVEEDFDVARFNMMARSVIGDIQSREKVPIICGGTGMYMQILLDGLFEGAPRHDGLREELLERISAEGLDALYQDLREIDEKAAQKIHPHDARRIIRALEVCLTTDQKFSDQKQERQGLWNEQDVRVFGLRMDRSLLYQRIDWRVDQMIEQGLVEEVGKLRGSSLSRTAQAIIGVKEITAYLNGEQSLADAVELMKKNTRNLAKRQMTWFRRDSRIHWVDVDPDVLTEVLAQDMMKRL